jgi:hypothetical protein
LRVSPLKPARVIEIPKSKPKILRVICVSHSASTPASATVCERSTMSVSECYPAMSHSSAAAFSSNVKLPLRTSGSQSDHDDVPSSITNVISCPPSPHVSVSVSESSPAVSRSSAAASSSNLKPPLFISDSQSDHMHVDVSSSSTCAISCPPFTTTFHNIIKQSARVAGLFISALY